MENLTVVIPYFNGHQTIRKLVASVPATIPIIIVDDCSDDPLQNDFARDNLQVLNLTKKGYFTGAVNAGITASQTDVLVLNQDSYLQGNDWLKILHDKKSDFALIGEGVRGSHPAWPNGYIHGTFMFMRRDMMEKVGLLNEKHYPLWGSTCEYQLRACRKGYKALPFRPIPGFTHLRDDHTQRFGSSITEMINREPKNKEWFIRTPPMISVIVPTYKHGRYLTSLVNSMIGGPTDLGEMPGQTFQSFELIIVDDASPDETYQISKDLADPMKGIHYVRLSRNAGTAAANNAGISRATGKYITVLCGDDMMEPDRLERMYEACLANPGKFVYDDLTHFKSGKRSKTHVLADFDYDILVYKNQAHCGIMWEKSWWRQVGGYPEIMRNGREDWAINVRLGLHGFCGHHLRDYAGYLYRREKQNRTIINTTPAHHKRFLQMIQGLHPEAYLKEKPMGCCGGRGSSKSAGRKANVPGLPGAASGQVLLEYLGVNVGKETYFGIETGQRYIFSAKEKIQSVFAEDAPQMLDMFDRGNQVFRRYVPPKPKPIKTRPVEKDTKQEVVEPEAEPIEKEIILSFVDPGDLSISAMKKELDNGQKYDIEKMLKVEQSEKARKGMIGLLESYV